MTIKDNVFNRIKRSGNLPALPEVLLRLLEAFDDAAASLAEIASIIQKDPALGARVLQLVNSSFYGLNRTFTGVEQAVVYLGRNSIKNLAVTTAVYQLFPQKRFESKRFNMGAFWWDALMCATLARRIAKKTGFSSPDEAYLSGLLHDIGRLVLLTAFPREYDTILAGGGDGQEVINAEIQAIGVSHCEAGFWLVHAWKLNSLMADAIQYHHGPADQMKEAFPLVKIVYVANLLKETAQACERDYAVGDQLLGLRSNTLQDILADAGEEVRQVAQDLNIRIVQPSAVDSTPESPAPSGGDRGPSVSRETSDGMGLEEVPAVKASAQTALAERVKSVALLAGILEDLIRAAESDAVISVFEESVRLLFGLTKVLFFLSDKDQMRLRGLTSAASPLHSLSQGMTLSVNGSTSLIVKAFRESTVMYLDAGDNLDVMADKQVLAAFRCTRVMLVPLLAGKQPEGVILLGLPEADASLSESDSRVLRMLAQQVGLCLYLEKMEQQKAEEVEAERMAAISMTARKFAHEINNPMGIIMNCLAVMGLKLARENEIQDELRIIGEEINRISSMVRHMDVLSQAAVARFELTDVNGTIDDIIRMVKTSLFPATGPEIVFRPEAGLPQIMTSRDALKQIMLNLLKNAAEAMDSGGSVGVRTAMLLKGSRGNTVPARDGIEVIVEDTGPGLPERVVTNLYKPLATTKGDGHSGLGLSIVYKTVKDIGGSISCTSIPDEGTKFSLYLPLEKKSAEGDE
ncbi:MAG: HDOD domain-containing protein [Desulfocapsaceae bacterium]|nr:HDOD domain-containing protein [Desulfocapsaceae bacterium]